MLSVSSSKSINAAITGIQAPFIAYSGDNNYNLLLNISEPVAAASIAQVHKAQLNDNETIKDIAIIILRPNIRN